MLFRNGAVCPASTAEELEARQVAEDYGPRQSLTLENAAQHILRSRLKRVLDVLGAALLILFFLPAFALISIAIFASSPGPIIFRQQRYGAGKQVFWLYKFRSMTVCESSGSFRQARRDDERVTLVGRLLRRSSLDELPQLFNVLAGHMSLVGPRPHAVAMDDAFSGMLPRYSDRHLVKPGLTGLAQIGGFRGPTDCHDKIAGRLREDRRYIAEWSLLLDLRILLRTPLELLGPNAH